MAGIELYIIMQAKLRAFVGSPKPKNQKNHGYKSKNIDRKKKQVEGREND